VDHKAEVIEAGKTFSLGWKGRLVVLAAVLVGLGVFVYGATLRDLFMSVWQREGSSHGLFVPLISGWFLWRERDRLRQTELGFALLPGTLVTATGFLLLFLARGTTDLALPILSFLAIVCGLVLLILGSGVFRIVSFPLLFLATMIPLPETIYEAIGEWIRASTTTGSVWLTQALQTPVYRDGYTIHLPSTSVFVDTSCSGVRYLLSYFVFSLPYAFICKKSFRARVLVVLASLPIAFVAGVLRLSSIYLAVYAIGPFMAEHRPHILLSWSVFALVLVLAIVADQYISRMWEKRRRRSAGIMEGWKRI
jgi:exosortase